MPRWAGHCVWVAALSATLGCGTRVLEAVTVVDAAPEDAPVPHTPDAAPVLDAPEWDVEPAPADGPLDLDPTLVAYWSCDEGSGPQVNDVTANQNHGEVQRGTPDRVWVPGRAGMALDLSGNTWVLVPSSPSLDAPARANAISLTAWVHLRSIGPEAFSFVVSRQAALTPFDNFGLAILNGRATFAHFTDFHSGTSAVPLGRWVHLAATFDGATVRVYMDGAQVTAAFNSRRLAPEMRPVVIGGNQNDGTGAVKEFLDGAVDEVRIYSRALRSEEIAALAR